MGASGSGKSTMMNSIGCLDRPTASRWAIETADAVHHGGFSGAAGAHDGHEFPGLYFQRDPAHGVNLNLSGMVGLGEVLQFDDELGHNPLRAGVGWISYPEHARQR